MNATVPHVGAVGHHAAAAPVAARIGPNAVIQLAHALDGRCGRGVTARVFRRAGLDRYLDAMPQAMVDEREVIALHAAARGHVDPATFTALARDAGRRTGDYVRDHRIPAFARRLLRLLPSALSAPLLARAIARNAWTFVGSGTLRVLPGRLPVFEVHDCPLCRALRSQDPSCDYYAATFERLFATLVDARLRVAETTCIARGDATCRFELRRVNARP